MIKTAKINDPKYKVVEMEQTNVLEFKNLADHHRWNLGISKLREIVLTGNAAWFKHNYDDEAKKIIPLPVRPGRPVNLSTFRLKQAYTSKFAVPDNILEDLKWYCDNGHIPSASQPFFINLLNPTEGLLPDPPAVSDFENDSESEPEMQHDSD
ncbi:Capsular polysaccharide phosphotransferase LcbA [Frankliniella fusca]|uniref:Capsular polysaccharide phosphotransferase LcbA n=1 Tax=Frankliniella fusca TaxID=407009 RepID=A0AAE1I2N5_9NEOP|nr:Capsular polysaccharide phosphotransferase LcbA [Frankliniella fusca]